MRGKWNPGSVINPAAPCMIIPKVLTPSLVSFILRLSAGGNGPKAILQRLTPFAGGQPQCSLSSINRILAAFRRPAAAPARLRPGPRFKLRRQHIRFIKRLKRQDSTLHHYEIKQRLFNRFGIDVSISTLHRLWKRMGWSRGVVTYGRQGSATSGIGKSR